MSRSSPRTWVYNELVTASIMNTHIRDQQDAYWPYTTAGDLPYATAADTITRLAAVNGGILKSSATAPSWLALSTAGKILTVNSGATAVEWGGLPCAKISEGEGQVLATGNAATVTLGDTDHDSNDFVAAPAANIITIPTGFDGWYLASYFVSFGAEAGGMRRMELRKNVGDTTIAHTRFSIMPVTTIATAQSMPGTAFIHLDAADYVKLNAYQNHGGNCTISAAALALTLVAKD